MCRMSAVKPNKILQNRQMLETKKNVNMLSNIISSIYAVKTGQFLHRSISLLVLRFYVRILNEHKYNSPKVHCRTFKTSL